jgi:short-subunit dehydrogenase
VEFIACDLSDPTERASLPGQVGALGLTVDVLVSNAGVGSSGEFVDLPADRELAMVRLNSEAVVGLCADFVPEMVKAGRGAVLIVSSSVAFQPIPRAATYSASKAFSLTFAESLHAELKRSGLSVTVVCPGPIDTEFGAVAGIPDLANQIPKSTMVPAAEVARQAVRGLARNRRVVVPGLTIRFAAAIGRYVPHGLLLRLYRRLWPL